MRDRIETAIPGRTAIELVSFYEEFRNYYPQCEMETKQWFVENVQPDWCICDVGANIGYYSILFSQLAPDGRVLAFEPTITATMLRKNLEHNGAKNVEVHQVALGSVTGVHQDRIFRLWGTDGELQAYPFYKLDDFVEEKGIKRIDCIKVDVDSFDFEVLRGAEQTLQKHNPLIVVELNHALSKRNQSAGEALAWLAHRGYERALVLDHDNFVLRRGEDAMLTPPGSKSLELVFPPPMRSDESIGKMVGEKVSKPLLNIGQLQNGAKFTSGVGEKLVRRSKGAAALLSDTFAKGFDIVHRLFTHEPNGQIAQGGDVDLSFVIGNEIETSPEMWSYAVVLEFDSISLKSLHPDGLLTVEVATQVKGGELGIALGSDSLSSFCSPERTVIAMLESQRIVISAPISKLRYLILRNVAPQGTRTIFELLSIQAIVR